jgi:hypothetical protein
MVLMTMFSIMLYRVAVIVSMYESTKGTVFSPYAGSTSTFSNEKVYFLTLYICFSDFLMIDNHNNILYQK